MDVLYIAVLEFYTICTTTLHSHFTQGGQLPNWPTKQMAYLAYGMLLGELQNLTHTINKSKMEIDFTRTDLLHCGSLNRKTLKVFYDCMFRCIFTLLLRCFQWGKKNNKKWLLVMMEVY